MSVDNVDLLRIDMLALACQYAVNPRYQQYVKSEVAGSIPPGAHSVVRFPEGLTPSLEHSWFLARHLLVT